MNKTEEIFSHYETLVRNQHKITSDFVVEEIGIEISHIDDTMLDLEDEVPQVHYLVLPAGYMLVKCRFTKSYNIKFFIVKV